MTDEGEKKRKELRRTHGDLHICWKNGAHGLSRRIYRWARKRIGIKKCVDLKQTQLDINVLNDMIYGEQCAENVFGHREYSCISYTYIYYVSGSRMNEFWKEINGQTVARAIIHSNTTNICY